MSRATRTLIPLSILLLASPAVAQQVDWRAVGNGGAVSAGGSQSVESGIEILERDGNAFDAAVATIFSLAVTDYGAFAFGGEVPIIIWDAARGEAKVLSGMGIAPSNVSYYLQNGIPTNGDLRAAPTPGAIHAGLTMLRVYGTMSLEEVTAPMRALLAARTGTTRFANLLSTVERMVAVEQQTLAAGATREAAINAVIAEVYDASVGQIAQALMTWYQSGGHFYTSADLAAQDTFIEDPVTVTYTNEAGETFQVLKAGTWTQGPTLSQTLRLVDGFGLSTFGHLSSDYIHVLTEALKLAFADRDTYYGDPRFANVPLQSLLSDAYTNVRRPLINLSAASFDRRPGNPTTVQPLLSGSTTQSNPTPLVPDTTTCVVADRFGNMVVATPSANVFGSNKDGGTTGITVGNRLRSLNTTPGHPNVIEPRKRPRITLTPTLILKDGRPIFGVSIAGGDLQEQTALNVSLNFMEFGMLPDEAVTQPRFNTNHLENSFDPNPNRNAAFGTAGSLRVNTAVPQSIRNELANRGHLLSTTSNSIAAPSALYVDASGLFYAAGDPNAGRHAAATSVSDGSIVSESFTAGAGSFTFTDDAFRNTSAPAYASGSFDGAAGALRVELGGVDDNDINGMSGAFTTTFTLAQPAEAVLSFRYNLTQAPNYESSERSEVLVAVDGNLIGRGSSDFVDEIVGDGNGGGPRSTGWRRFGALIGPLAAGAHTVTIGGFNNLKTLADESTTLLIDDVSVGGFGAPSPVVEVTALGTVVSGNLAVGSISATAFDPDVGPTNGAGIADVRFELRQGAIVLDTATDSLPPYEYGFDSTQFSDGVYSVRAAATSQGSGNIGAAEVSIEIRNSVSTVLVDADFETSAEGFAYSDGAFGGQTPAYASGTLVASGGNGGGGALQVTLGGIDNSTVRDMSGGFTLNFQVPVTSQVELQLAYNLTLASDYESDELGRALARIDSTLLGPNGVIRQIAGNGNGGSADSSGWQIYRVDLGVLASGSHTLTLGGFNNKKTFNNESTVVLFDDIRITGTAVGNAAPVANDDAVVVVVGGSVQVDVLANDTDLDGTLDPSSIFVTALPAQGTLLFDSVTGRLTYTHGVGAAGTDTFTYTVQDLEGALSNEATVDITIRPAGPVTLLSATFDASSDGFTYVDDAFRGTSASTYASGSRVASGGAGNSGALQVVLGGRNNTNVFGMSGGFTRSFNVPVAGPVTLSFDAVLTLASEYESDEFGQVLVAVDGQLQGDAGPDYIVQLNGNGNGGPDDSTGLQTVTLNLGNLAAGAHSVTLGGYNNKKTYNNETTEVLIDNVRITAP